MRANHRREWYRSRKPTRRELETLALVLTVGRKDAAHRLGISERTVVHHLTSLYGRLDVDSAPKAALALGWMVVPPEHMTAGAGVHSALRSAPAVDADILAEAVVHYVDARLGRTKPMTVEARSLDPDYVLCDHGYLRRGWCYDCI